MSLRTAIPAALLLPALLLPAVAAAQPALDQSVDGLGGGPSSSGPYAVLDTTGEPLVGEAVSAAYTIRLGFLETLNLAPAPRQDLLLASAQGGKIPLSALIANDVEPDAEPLTLGSVSATGGSGGSVTVSDGWLLYRPASSSITSELLTYTVTDSSGHSSVGTVLVQRPDATETAPRNLISLAVLPGGTRSVRFAGIAGRSYSIQTKNDLGEPSWTEQAVRVAGPNGQFEFEDPELPAPAQRYYRAMAR